MKKRKIVFIFLLIVVIVAALKILIPKAATEIKKENVITSSQLKNAINISQLSTAEFVYNGLAEKYADESTEEVECYIAYDANVKVGIQMEDVAFNIDEENKVIQPVLPEISVNIATLEEDSISYIPKNPDLSLKEVITLCKKDAVNEANSSTKLYQTAEDNLKSVIEALLSPILNSAGYKIVWQVLYEVGHEN